MIKQNVALATRVRKRYFQELSTNNFFTLNCYTLFFVLLTQNKKKFYPLYWPKIKRSSTLFMSCGSHENIQNHSDWVLPLMSCGSHGKHSKSLWFEFYVDLMWIQIGQPCNNSTQITCDNFSNKNVSKDGQKSSLSRNPHERIGDQEGQLLPRRAHHPLEESDPEKLQSIYVVKGRCS